MAWFTQFDGLQPAPRPTSLAPALPSVAAQPFIAVQWLSRPDSLPLLKRLLESPAVFVKAPTASVPISGMAWFEPRDAYIPPTLGRDIAPAFAPKTIAQVVAAPNVAWQAPPDERRAARVPGEGVPAFPLPVSQIVLGAWWARPNEQQIVSVNRASDVPPMPFAPGAPIRFGWFVAREILSLERKGSSADRPAFVFKPTPPTPTPTIWWHTRDERRPIARPVDQPIAGFAASPPPAVITVVPYLAWHQPTDEVPVKKLDTSTTLFVNLIRVTTLYGVDLDWLIHVKPRVRSIALDPFVRSIHLEAPTRTVALDGRIRSIRLKLRSRFFTVRPNS
jgi:hypothetical protein